MSDKVEAHAMARLFRQEMLTGGIYRLSLLFLTTVFTVCIKT